MLSFVEFLNLTEDLFKLKRVPIEERWVVCSVHFRVGCKNFGDDEKLREISQKSVKKTDTEEDELKLSKKCKTQSR